MRGQRACWYGWPITSAGKGNGGNAPHVLVQAFPRRTHTRISRWGFHLLQQSQYSNLEKTAALHNPHHGMLPRGKCGCGILHGNSVCLLHKKPLTAPFHGSVRRLLRSEKAGFGSCYNVALLLCSVCKCASWCCMLVAILLCTVSKLSFDPCITLQ
jgi:hypothetical protein